MERWIQKISAPSDNLSAFLNLFFVVAQKFLCGLTVFEYFELNMKSLHLPVALWVSFSRASKAKDEELRPNEVVKICISVKEFMKIGANTFRSMFRYIAILTAGGLWRRIKFNQYLSFPLSAVGQWQCQVDLCSHLQESPLSLSQCWVSA